MMTEDARRYRAQLAGHAARGHGPDHPEVIEARRRMRAAQQTDAALTVLSAIEARNNVTPEQMVERLRGTRGEVSLRLLEATELMAYVVRLSDRPDELLAALRERVSAAGTD